jgi:hypothetical protein
MSCKSEHAGVARLMDLLAQTELAPTIIETAVESGLAQVHLILRLRSFEQ